MIGFWDQWRPLLPIWMVAPAVRILALPDMAHPGDMEHFAIWSEIIHQKGLFTFYEPSLRLGVWDRTYPPLSTFWLGFLALIHHINWRDGWHLQDPHYVILLKLLPVACEMAIIASLYWWLRNKRPFNWIVPTLMALAPGPWITSAWWGQFESTYVLFLVLTLLALNADSPVWAWLSFAIAVSFKQPAAALFPLLLVLTYRRCGWQRTLTCLIAFAAIFWALLLPFVAGSGFDGALSPYLKASGVFPFLSNNAYNLWYAVAYLRNGQAMILFDPHYTDQLSLIGPISFKMAGYILFGLVLMQILSTAWRRPHANSEFVLATALFLAVYMLPTQVHERYMYPAVVLGLFAIGQTRRMGWVAVPMLITFSYNILNVVATSKYRLPNLIGDWASLLCAVFNLGLLSATLYMIWIEAREIAEPKLIYVKEATKRASACSKATGAGDCA